MNFDYNGHLHDICVDRSVGIAAVLGLHLSKLLAVYQPNMNPGGEKEENKKSLKKLQSCWPWKGKRNLSQPFSVSAPYSDESFQCARYCVVSCSAPCLNIYLNVFLFSFSASLQMVIDWCTISQSSLFSVLFAFFSELIRYITHANHRNGHFSQARSLLMEWSKCFTRKTSVEILFTWSHVSGMFRDKLFEHTKLSLCLKCLLISGLPTLLFVFAHMFLFYIHFSKFTIRKRASECRKTPPNS